MGALCEAGATKLQITIKYKIYRNVALCRRERLSIVRGEVGALCEAGATKLQITIEYKIYRNVAQLGSAPCSGRGGRRFESCHSDFLLSISTIEPAKLLKTSFLYLVRF